jgi:hypothetical protein
MRCGHLSPLADCAAAMRPKPSPSLGIVFVECTLKPISKFNEIFGGIGM